MTYTMGLDVGSTYTKGIILDENLFIVARHLVPSGSKLQEVAQAVKRECARLAGIKEDAIAYGITTGYGRHQAAESDLQITDLTATAWGGRFLFPDTRTVLDIGGQTMKASRIDASGKVRTFRLNDKCASGSGTFLEKTVRYMGLNTSDIEGMLDSASEPASISGVCTVFAESEVINHLSNSVPPENIMFGAATSLTGRSIQLLRRVKIEGQLLAVGGIMRWGRLAQAIEDDLKVPVNVPEGDMPQYVAALGAAILGHLCLGTANANQLRRGAVLARDAVTA